jgi:hypothetical protein
MAIRRSKRPRVRRDDAVGVRDTRPGPTKAELREQAAEAVASYAGPVTRCAPPGRDHLRPEASKGRHSSRIGAAISARSRGKSRAGRYPFSLPAVVPTPPPAMSLLRRTAATPTAATHDCMVLARTLNKGCRSSPMAATPWLCAKSASAHTAAGTRRTKSVVSIVGHGPTISISRRSRGGDITIRRRSDPHMAQRHECGQQSAPLLTRP